jgi:hypothetical protein
MTRVPRRFLSRSPHINGYFSELRLDDLATLKADGGVIAVDERAIRDQPASADISSPYFDEQRQRIIAYSNVAPGDKVRGRLTYKAKRPEFAGEFAYYWSQPADQPPEVIELTLDGPASKPLQVALRNVEHSEERLGDRIVHHVRFTQATPKPRQMDAGSFDDAKRFEVSTFADYAAFAAMLNDRNAPMAQPDESLRKLSIGIVGDATDTRVKVERIHNWVARNIRYVGIGFEDGGWTSQPASAVLASRYGDCKAHATILKALLAAQGIEANLVAVNGDAQYTLTEVAPRISTTPSFMCRRSTSILIRRYRCWPSAPCHRAWEASRRSISIRARSTAFRWRSRTASRWRRTPITRCSATERAGRVRSCPVPGWVRW